MLHKIVQESVEKFDNEFIKESTCEHGFTKIHYTCEQHKYPHVLGNRFGEDCETCNPPQKKTPKDFKHLLISSHISIIEAEISRKKGMIIYQEDMQDAKTEELIKALAKNELIQDDITYLEKELEELKKIV